MILMGVSLQAQSILAARIAGDPMFDGTQSDNGLPIPVVIDYEGDLGTEVQVAIDKLGVCVVVLIPQFKLFNWKMPGGGGWLTQVVNVWENVLLNQTKLRAPDLCERIFTLTKDIPTGLQAELGTPSQWWPVEVPWVRTAIGPPLQYAVTSQINCILPTLVAQP